MQINKRDETIQNVKEEDIFKSWLNVLKMLKKCCFCFP